jgi:DNA-directed RNA polymerase specialized sigma24 family protein
MLDVLDTLIVRETLERLPPTERRLAELLMAGSSPYAAAQALGLNRTPLKRHLRRLRAAFRNTDDDALFRSGLSPLSRKENMRMP